MNESSEVFGQMGASEKTRIAEQLQQLRKRTNPGMSLAAMDRAVQSHIPRFPSGKSLRLEKGWADASPDEIRAIATVLSVPLEALLPDGAGTKPNQPAVNTSAVHQATPTQAAAKKPEVTPIPVAIATSRPAEPMPTPIPARGSEGLVDYRRRLSALLQTADRHLHMRGLSAATWRAWKAHHQEVRSLLVSLAN